MYIRSSPFLSQYNAIKLQIEANILTKVMYVSTQQFSTSYSWLDGQGLMQVLMCFHFSLHAEQFLHSTFSLASMFLIKFFIMHFQDENGNKRVNEYVREYKIGAGSYGKVVSIVLMTLFCISCLQQLFLQHISCSLFSISPCVWNRFYIEALQMESIMQLRYSFFFFFLA